MDSDPNAAPADSGPVRFTLRPSLWRRAGIERREELVQLVQALEATSGLTLKPPPWPASPQTVSPQTVSPQTVWKDESMSSLACARLLAEVRLGLTDSHVIVALFNAEGGTLSTAQVELEPFRPLIRSYWALIQKLGGKISMHVPSTFEALDMGRRAFHNEAGQMLVDALDTRLTLDLETARRLFSLLCVAYV